MKIFMWYLQCWALSDADRWVLTWAVWSVCVWQEREGGGEVMWLCSGKESKNRKRRRQFTNKTSVCAQRVCVCVIQHFIMSNQQRPSHSKHAASCCFPQVSSSLCVAVAMFHRRKKKRRPEISVPQDFQHRVHTSFDAATGRYVGLPPQWQSVIDTLRRPRPLVDPSRITEVELRKVRGSHSGTVSSHFCQ